MSLHADARIHTSCQNRSAPFNQLASGSWQSACWFRITKVRENWFIGRRACYRSKAFSSEIRPRIAPITTDFSAGLWSKKTMTPTALTQPLKNEDQVFIRVNPCLPWQRLSGLVYPCHPCLPWRRLSGFVLSVFIHVFRGKDFPDSFYPCSSMSSVANTFWISLSVLIRVFRGKDFLD